MSKLKIAGHADVLTALDLVKDEVDKESKRIFNAGADAFKAEKIESAEEAIAYAKKLRAFVGKVAVLGEEWKQLQDEIDTAAPEVREIVLPTKVRKTKTGYTRKVTTVAPTTNFTVTFPDGTVVADKKAKNVFAKSLTRLGADKVAALGIVMASEPLVGKKAEFKKTPTQIAPLGGGLFVNTHSSTTSKMSLLSKIATRLGVVLKIDVVK